MKFRRRWSSIAILIFLFLMLLLAGYKAANTRFIKEGHRSGLLQQKIAYGWAYLTGIVETKILNPMLGVEFWSVESPNDREKLPLYQTLKASASFTIASEIEPKERSSWDRSNGDNTSSKYSNLTMINRGNIDRLQKVWTYETPGAKANIQATPVFTGSLLVFPNALNQIVAVEPDTGKQLWAFDPKISKPAQRGLVYWPGTSTQKPRIYFAAGGRLFSLDAATGLPSVSFNNGSVALGYEIRVAPAISGDILLVTSFKPALHAFDVVSGSSRWTTDFEKSTSGEGSPEPALIYEGAHTWGGFSVDDDSQVAFMTTNNATPVGVGIHRRGRNPMANSVLAIDIKTGKHLWDFQEIGHDLWDLDIGAPPVLATIKKDGQRIAVVVAVTKAGNTLVLDRVSGQPIFDFRMRRAPTSLVPGERTSPYQPDLLLPEPFARQDFNIDAVTNIGEMNRQSVLKQLENANYGFYVPHEPGKPSVFFGLHGGAMQMGPGLDARTGILYIASTHEPSMFGIAEVRPKKDKLSIRNTQGLQAFTAHCAACHGPTSNGGGIAPTLTAVSERYDAAGLKALIKNGYQSMPALPDISESDLNQLLAYLLSGKSNEVGDGPATTGGGYPQFVRTGYSKLRDFEGYPGSKPPWGTLNALNLNTGRMMWRVPLGRYQALIDRGLPPTGTENFGGPLVTAGGLVFVSGTKDRLIRAFDADSGSELWEYELPFVGSASPMTYIYKNRQFVLIPATGGGTLALYDPSVATGSTFVAFGIGNETHTP